MDNTCPMCGSGTLVPCDDGFECDNCGQYFELDDSDELIIPSLKEFLDNPRYNDKMI